MAAVYDEARCGRIKDSMQEIFNHYNALRKDLSARTHTAISQKNETRQSFWDIVVLTAFDKAQKICFEHQVNSKRKHGQLPEVPIYVIADPPGQKLGVGGSTLHVLSELHKEMAELIYEKKILIIHSGGSSQRLPSYSAIGKIFSPVPAKGLMVGSQVSQMLDLKLALYLPFCCHLGPGVFVTCADDIETYHLDVTNLDLQSLQSADVVALAHPSSLNTGEGHGVYVIDPTIDTSQACVCDCVDVLQKPSQQQMHHAGAVWIQENGGSKKECVWSDSVFWLGKDLCRELLGWFSTHSPFTGELDAYAHFLPCLGSRRSQAQPSDFSDFCAQMLPIFQGRKFKVILLPDSEFYHLGTMEEYLMHFNVMRNFCHELEIVRNTSNNENPCIVKCDEDNAHLLCKDVGVLIQTDFSDESLKITVYNDSIQFVVEKCSVGIPISINGNVIVSSCKVKKCQSILLLTNTITIFDNLLYHTVPIMHQGNRLYVTVAFDLNARMKAVSDTLSGIRNYDHNLSEVNDILDLKLMPNPKEKVSLWNARIFCGAETPEESFWLTHHDVNKVRHETDGVPLETDVSNCKKCGMFSMSDIVEFKDLNRL